MRAGIFGGTFDPVHFGHLLLAECCRESCQLELVIFMPAAKSPHKIETKPASVDARVEMLQLAIGGHESFEVSRREIDRGGVSYTVDTLAGIKKDRPDDELFFLMGADSLADFPTWRDPQRICDLATPIFVSRPQSELPDFGELDDVLSDASVDAIRDHHVQMPQIELSSSEIRRRVEADATIRFQTPRAVEKYIETHELYQRQVD